MTGPIDDSRWITIISARANRSHAIELVRGSTVFQVRTYSKRDYISTFLLIPSAFGQTVQENNISQLVARLAFEETPDFARELQYKLGTMNGQAFQFNPELVRYFECADMMPIHALETLVPTARVQLFPGPLITDPHIVPGQQDVDQDWQQASARQIMTQCRLQSIADPLHTTHMSSYGTRRVEMTRGGWIREVDTNAPRLSVPYHASFIAGGCLLFEKTGMGKTRAAIRSMQANIQDYRHNQSEHANRCDVHRQFLPKTAMVVVPAHVLTTWKKALQDLWPNASVWTLENKKSFHNLAKALLPEHPHVATIDVLLVSRDALFKAVASDSHSSLVPKLDSLVGSTDENINVLERVQFNTVILDEAHEYAAIGGTTPSTIPGKFKTFDGGMVITRSTVTIRKLAYGRSTILLTATPFRDTLSTPHSINNYLVMIGMTHTEFGPITPRPASYRETQTATLLHSRQYDMEIQQSHPSQITAQCKTKLFFITVDPHLLQRAQVAFVTSCVVHTNASMTLDVRNLEFTYSEHPLIRILGKLSTFAESRCRTMPYPLHDHAGQKRAFEYVIQQFKFPLGESLQITVDRFFDRNPLPMAFGVIGLAARVDDQKDHAADDNGHDIVRIANEVFLPPNHKPTGAVDLASVRMLVTITRLGGSVIVYAGLGSDTPRLLVHLLAMYEIDVIEFKGSAAQLQKRQKQFHSRPKQTILMLHPLHIDGTNIPEATHIVVLGEANQTELDQVIGRATRFGRMSPLYVIRLRLASDVPVE